MLQTLASLTHHQVIDRLFNVLFFTLESLTSHWNHSFIKRQWKTKIYVFCMGFDSEQESLLCQTGQVCCDMVSWFLQFVPVCLLALITSMGYIWFIILTFTNTYITKRDSGRLRFVPESELGATLVATERREFQLLYDVSWPLNSTQLTLLTTRVSRVEQYGGLLVTLRMCQFSKDGCDWLKYFTRE
jgi:hypothetical protein